MKYIIKQSSIIFVLGKHPLYLVGCCLTLLLAPLSHVDVQLLLHRLRYSGLLVDCLIESEVLSSLPEHGVSGLRRTWYWLRFPNLIVLTLFLNAIHPRAFAYSSVGVGHLSVAVPQIVLELPGVLAPIFPCVYTFSALLIVHVLSRVGVSVFNRPYASPVSLPCQKPSFVGGSVVPVVLPVALRLG